MNTQILVSVILLIIFVLIIVLLRKRQSSKNDYDHSLSHVFELTWDYFKTHPSTREFTEVHSSNGCFQIFAHGTDSCHRYEVTIVYPDDSDVYNKEFEGEEAEKDVEAYILDKLNLQYQNSVQYQITALGGPEKYFSFED